MEFTSRFNVKTGVIINKQNVDTRIAASAEAVEAIRDVVGAAFSGPWVTKVDYKILEIQTKCENGHRLKRYDAPIGERGAHGGLGCDVCGGGIAKCEDGYYNCGQDCNWDACTKCAKEEPA